MTQQQSGQTLLTVPTYTTNNIIILPNTTNNTEHHQYIYTQRHKTRNQQKNNIIIMWLVTIIHLFSLLQLTSSGFLSSIASAAGKSLNMGHGRGVGRGRASRHFDASTSSSFNPNPIDGSTLNWRSQLRNSLRSTTEQGCDLNVIALSTPTGDPLTKDVAGLSPSKTLYHLGWYTGLEMVQYCHT